MATTTNYGWTTPDDTALVKDGAAAIRTLGSSVDTTTKALNPSTTLGDIEYRSSTANTNTRLGIGSTGQVLTVAGGVPSWATAAAGGMTLIQETVASANSSIDFSSIPGTYKDLILYWEGIVNSTTSDEFTLRFNNDSSGIYNLYENYFEATSTTINRSQYTAASQKMFGTGATSTSSAGTVRGSLIIYNYASTTKVKYYEHNYAFYDNGTARNNLASAFSWYDSTTAITSLNIVRTNGAGTLTNQSNTSIRLIGVS
jgi:hypothetical protein